MKSVPEKADDPHVEKHDDEGDDGEGLVEDVPVGEQALHRVQDRELVQEPLLPQNQPTHPHAFTNRKGPIAAHDSIDAERFRWKGGVIQKDAAQRPRESAGLLPSSREKRFDPSEDVFPALALPEEAHDAGELLLDFSQSHLVAGNGPGDLGVEVTAEGARQHHGPHRVESNGHDPVQLSRSVERHQDRPDDSEKDVDLEPFRLSPDLLKRLGALANGVQEDEEHHHRADDAEELAHGPRGLEPGIELMLRARAQRCRVIGATPKRENQQEKNGKRDDADKNDLKSQIGFESPSTSLVLRQAGSGENLGTHFEPDGSRAGRVVRARDLER